eukprot:gene15049-17651_t
MKGFAQRNGALRVLQSRFASNKAHDIDGILHRLNVPKSAYGVYDGSWRDTNGGVNKQLDPSTNQAIGEV